MTEPMSDERLADIRKWVTERPWKVDGFTLDLLPEVDRLRAALARATDVERLHRAYLEAQLGRAMDDDEYADSRSRAEICWLESAIRAVADDENA